MKTFVINKYKIKADTVTDAVKVAKILQKDNNQTQYAVESKEEADAMLKKMGISFGKTVKAAGTEDIHYFKGDEKVAIYSPVRKFLYVFSNPVTVDSIKDDDTIRTPRGTFKLSNKPYHQLQEEGWGFWFDYADLYYDRIGPWYKIMHNPKTNQAVAVIYKSIKDSVKADDEEDLAFLTEEERKAVEEYKQAIANTSNPKLLELYKHILEDEMEHIRELQNGEVD